MGESCVLDRGRTFTVPDMTSYQSPASYVEERERLRSGSGLDTGWLADGRTM